MFALLGFIVDRNTVNTLNFKFYLFFFFYFNKLVSTVFEIFRRYEAKNKFFIHYNTLPCLIYKKKVSLILSLIIYINKFCNILSFLKKLKKKYPEL